MKRPLYNAFKSLLFNRGHFVAALLYRFGGWIPDETYLRIVYWLDLKKRLDLDHPKTYTEKLQWLKLYYRHPLLTTMVDKLEVKKMVADLIGEEYVIPTLGSWSSVEEIEWDKLPNKFVLKTNHDSGNFGVVICKDKESFDKKKAMQRLNQSLCRDSYQIGREWPYKNVKRRIFAEQYIENTSIGDLMDYKFYCFNGTAQYLCICSGRTNSKNAVDCDFYDMEFKHIDMAQPPHKNSIGYINKPRNFEHMKLLLEKLSNISVEDNIIPHVRIDLYETTDKIYFGEYTFFDAGGLAPFTPDRWNYIFGDMIVLPEKMIKT